MTASIERAYPQTTCGAASSQRAEPDRTSTPIDRVQRFLDKAVTEQWYAHIVLQLAEAVGDKVDSLPGYIAELLATASSLCGEHSSRLDGDQPRTCELPTHAHAKYMRWFAQLGELVRPA